MAEVGGVCDHQRKLRDFVPGSLTDRKQLRGTRRDTVVMDNLLTRGERSKVVGIGLLLTERADPNP